jgi:hypothetical protein
MVAELGQDMAEEQEQVYIEKVLEQELEHDRFEEQELVQDMVEEQEYK